MTDKQDIAKMEFRLTGFIIGLIIVSMFASGFGLFLAAMQNEYNIQGNNSLLKYNKTEELIKDADEMRNATNIDQDAGVLDIIGAYYSSGWKALRTAWNSFALFEEMMTDNTLVAEDVSFLQRYNILTYLLLIVLIGLFVGIGVTALIKMRL